VSAGAIHALAQAAAPLMPQLVLAPIALPLLTAALMLLLREERARAKLVLNLLSTAFGLFIALALLAWSADAGPATVAVYLPGNWRAPFGIALALDRLSALMLVLTGAVALASVVYAAAGWHRAGVHYHPLFQFQLMGLAGAFLTADLFNLFVFFEVLLAASYGLLLHGSGRARVQAGLHYIAINLAASSLFLIGAAMLYGLTGTLNMADLARAVAQVPAADLGLLHAAAGILACAFLVKAGVWPLNFWLVPAYGAAAAPVGALFALMTKVGVYAVLRLWTLLFGAGAAMHFGADALVAIGIATMAVGAVGMLGSQRIAPLAGHAAIVSSGTLLAALGLDQIGLTAALLYYLPSSTLAIAALFLLADLIERRQGAGERAGAVDVDAPFLSPELLPTEGVNLDEDQTPLVGRVIPAAAAFLGLSFVAAALVIVGLPPLSGFVGKFALIGALLNPLGLGAARGAAAPSAAGWTLFALLIATGLLALIAFSRAGIRLFWSLPDRAVPRLRLLEGLPVAALLAACALLTVGAAGVLDFTRAAADQLHAPGDYADAVLSAQPVPSPVGGAGKEAR
jgi:multicomponent K+:H+ antiporter subunit D